MNLTNDIFTIAELSGLNLKSVEPPVLGYNTLKRQLVYSFIGINNYGKEILIELRIRNNELYTLEDLNVYTPNGTVSSILTGFISLTASVGSSFSVPFSLFYNTPQITTPPPASIQIQQTYFQQATENSIFVLNTPVTIQTGYNNFITSLLSEPVEL